MDQNTKKKIATIKQLIKKQQFQEALDQAEILTYKNSKLYQTHLLAGLCCDKLKKYKDAQKFYLQALDLKPGEPNALKAICQIYNKMGDVNKSAQYMESMLVHLKTTDPIKYRQNLVKLVQMYQRNQDMEKIDKIFQQLLESQSQISEEFVSIATMYFQTGVTNRCFFLQNFLPLGMKGEQFRSLHPNAKQKLNYLLVEIVRYLYSVKIEYKMDNKDVATCIYQMRYSFPHASCFLFLYLFDDYCVSQSAYNSVILQEIYMFLMAFFDRTNNCYLDMETLEPEYFVISAILSYEFLAFMKEFFILDECFNPYYERLEAFIPELEGRKVREEYNSKMSKFILKQCRTLSKMVETQNVEDKLEQLKYRIIKLDGSYLQEVVAKMAMNCFVNYQKLNDMKNLLKTRINNLPEGVPQPHLYKYYYDYLIKIAKLYRSLDEQISIYDAIAYVHTNDDKDNKYLIQYEWVEVGKNSKTTLKQTARKSLTLIEDLLPKLSGSLKSQTIRKQTVLKIILEQYQGVLDGLKLALGTDRSFQNLMCIGFYYLIQADYERSLRFLKQAFVLRQDDYHLNRAIFIAMIKLKETKEAYNFLERIYEGFPNVYWVNYILAMHSINNRKIQSAQKYLAASLQAFNSGINKQFKFSYEKTIEGEKYSLLYLIDQNNFHLLFDQIVIPEVKIYELFPMASSIFFSNDKEIKQIRIETQLGQVFKLLGRNKSSYNHLATANSLADTLSEQAMSKNLMQIIATKKQFATMLFYVRAYKESEELFRKVLKFLQNVDSTQINDLTDVYTSEIHSLLFEVSIKRLDELMKFESYESVEQYINKFTQSLGELKTIVKKPSLNYFKSKYQFHILCYFHNKELGIQKGIQTIQEFLKFFGLQPNEIETDSFYNRLLELKNEERVIVKQCLEDHLVLKYIKQNRTDNTEKITPNNVLPLIQLFPTSSVFYIVYGMTVEENKLKIAAFLKCIQLDRQSPISVDLLASLFLKEKDYLTACKLFLKSLQIDLFSTKSYIGLCTCLYVLIGSSIKRGQLQDNVIIKKALNKINSYMEFLRIVDPSQNYHLLKFLKILISDQPIPLFELKAGLEQSRKLTAHKYSQKLLFKLLEESTEYMKDFNIWKNEQREGVLKRYLENNCIPFESSLRDIGVALLKKAQEEIKNSSLLNINNVQIKIKIKCKVLNKVSIAANIFKKAKQIRQQDINQFISLCQQLTSIQSSQNDQLTKLQKSAKDSIIMAYINAAKSSGTEGKQVLQKVKQLNMFKIFKQIRTFSHVEDFLTLFNTEKDLVLIKKYLFLSMHSCPSDLTLRKSLLNILLLVEKKNNKNIKKIKQVVDYSLDNSLQMNTDEQVGNSSRFHRKHALMFNIQQPNAWIGFIAGQWKNQKSIKWIAHLKKLVKMDEGKISAQSKSKAQAILVQMLAYSKTINQPQEIPKQYQKITDSLSRILLSLKGTVNKQQMIESLKACPSQKDLLMKFIVPQLVKKYSHNASLNKILTYCAEISQKPQTKGFYNLLKFISLSGQQIKDQDGLIQQLKDFLDVTVECQSGNSKVSNNALIFMKCMIALMSLNFEQLENQLNLAYSGRFVTQSEQVIINYFELMRIFREVQLNHQGEGVYESFTEFVNSMITIAKDPLWKGFFFSLKALAQAIVGEEASKSLSRQIKYSTLLNPKAGASIMRKQE